MLKKRLGIEAIESNWEGEYICYYYKIPTSLIIPEDCEYVGRGVFQGCDKLKKVKIPRSVEYIGSWAFDGCESLKKVRIPGSVKNIGFYAFRGCCNAEVIIGKPKSEFNSGIFISCKSVEYVEEEIRS